MDKNQKRFGIYVFLSTFSRNLIEVFIPVILYKFGYSLKEVILYYLIVNVFSLLISYPFVAFSKKFNNKILSIIGVVAFLLVQILLNHMVYSITYIFAIAILYAIYRRGYWLSRRYYNLKIIKKDKISSTYSIISIINQVGVIISAYCGSLILDYVSLNVLTAIAIILFLISIIPLYKLEFKHEKNNSKLEVLKNIKKIPKRNLYLFGSYELINVVKFLFPLYLYIYVKNTYQTIGILNLITNIAIILFTYVYGKKLDTTKNNFLTLSILITVSIYFMKANIMGYILVIISFLEGVATKMYELTISKEFYTLSKKFEYSNYNLIYELIQNSFRSIIVLILYVFNMDLRTMIFVTLFFILIGAFYRFKQLDIEDYEARKDEIEKNNEKVKR